MSNANTCIEEGYTTAQKIPQTPYQYVERYFCDMYTIHVYMDLAEENTRGCYQW